MSTETTCLNCGTKFAGRISQCPVCEANERAARSPHKPVVGEADDHTVFVGSFVDPPNDFPTTGGVVQGETESPVRIALGVGEAQLRRLLIDAKRVVLFHERGVLGNCGESGAIDDLRGAINAVEQSQQSMKHGC